jgi:hypothetical protein
MPVCWYVRHCNMINRYQHSKTLWTHYHTNYYLPPLPLLLLIYWSKFNSFVGIFIEMVIFIYIYIIHHQITNSDTVKQFLNPVYVSQNPKLTQVKCWPP